MTDTKEMLESRVLTQDQRAVPDNTGKIHLGAGPVTTEGKAIPTCTVCEKVLIAEMREKYGLFDAAYGIGHAMVNAWIYLGLPKEKRCAEEDNVVRKCRTCEKVRYRQMRDKSSTFNSFYRVLDATIEGWMDKFLDDNDKERAFGRDPAHAQALAKFNPRNYYMGEAFIIGVKFDGCIAQEVHDGFPDKIGEPVDGVKKILTDLKDHGAKIVLYGWRSNECVKGNPTYRKQAERWMKARGIPYDHFYDGKGRLVADVFLSQRNLGGSLSSAHETIVSMIEDPQKGYISRRHIL